MNTQTYRTTTLLLMIALLISSSGLAAAQPPTLSAARTVQAVSDTDTTLDLCMYNEPSSLYLYAESVSLWQTLISSAIYDGPIDSRTFSYQPVIFKSLPTLDNGGAYFTTLSVDEGDTIVDSSGNVVVLAPGVTYLPTGCYDPSCAVEYASGPVELDQMRVKHTLVEGLLWSDGEPLTAGDLVYSYKLDADVDTPSSKDLIERTQSFEAASETETLWTGLPGYIDPTYYLNVWTPLPEHAWSSYTALELLTAEVSSRTPIGWGPYVIDEWVSGSHINMHKNPLYFRAAEGLPHFDSLIVHFGTELAGMLDGTCDIVPRSTEDLATSLRYDDDGLFEVDISAGTTWEHLDFGIQSNPLYTGFAALTHAFQDVGVRQAFAYCIDRQAIADAAYAGVGIVANSLISDEHPYFPDDAVIYPYDPDQGRALLSAAGWTDTNADGRRDRDGIEFSVTLHTSTSALRYLAASMIAADMAACGVEVIPVHVSSSVLFAGWPDGVLFGRNFDLGEFAWLTGSIPSCDLYASWNIPSDETGGQNDPGYADPDYDAACGSAIASLSEADRLKNYSEVIRLFNAELPVLPLFMLMKYGMAASHITGFVIDPTDNHIWNIEELSVGIQEVIPTDGGELVSPEDTTTYLFASDTFTDTVSVSHVPLSPVDLPDTGELDGAGHFYSVEATVDEVPVEPTEPYTVTIEYTDGELGILMEDTLGLYYWDGDSWVLEPTSVVNPDTNTLTATPDHFSIWAVLGEPYLFSFLPLIGK